MLRKISWEEQQKAPYTPQQFALWGVNWPPPRGWRKALAAEYNPNLAPEERHAKAVVRRERLVSQ